MDVFKIYEQLNCGVALYIMKLLFCNLLSACLNLPCLQISSRLWQFQSVIKHNISTCEFNSLFFCNNWIHEKFPSDVGIFHYYTKNGEFLCAQWALTSVLAVALPGSKSNTFLKLQVAAWASPRASWHFPSRRYPCNVLMNSRSKE